MKRDDFPAPREGFLLTHFLSSNDVERSRAFYSGVLGGEVVLEKSPCIGKLANGWIVINDGGGPTEGKPEVTLAPPSDPTRVSSFLKYPGGRHPARYEKWRAKGAQFVTPPSTLRLCRRAEAVPNQWPPTRIETTSPGAPR